MIKSDRGRKALRGLVTTACGVLGFVLFRWTPTTGIGIFTYVILFAVLVLMAIILSSRRRRGYWPGTPEDH
jgi:type IV secretory pathway TrbD component